MAQEKDSHYFGRESSQNFFPKTNLRESTEILVPKRDSSEGLVPKRESTEMFELEKRETSIHSVGVFCWVIWAVVLGLCALFSLYIILVFFAKPVADWKTVSSYTATKRAVPIGLHWFGGIILMMFGPFQLLPQIRNFSISLHRWMGRIYLLAMCITCVCGITYIIVNGTHGGVVMDLPFYIYGVLFLVCGGLTYYYARQKKMLLHRDWALRTFCLGISSAFYRLLISPLFVSSIAHLGGWISMAQANLWLNVAAWLFYFPILAVCELYLYYKWRRGFIEFAVDKFL